MIAGEIEGQLSDSIGFARLHALAQRGYRPLVGATSKNMNFIEMVHPRVSGRNVPPPVTVWSDGIIATPKILWPEKYVEAEGGPPDWQRFITSQDTERFDSFASSVARPSVSDLYILPSIRSAKTFLSRFFFGTTLCVLMASALKLSMYALQAVL